jgi:DMSO/TMAO reductase YedYZ heme-binding membrane subunit
MMIRGRMSNCPFVSLCLVLAVIFVVFIGRDVLPMKSDTPPRSFHASLFIIEVVAATLPRLPTPRPWCSAAALGILAAIFVVGLFGPELCRLLQV